MTDAKVSSPTSPKRRSWLKILAGVLGTLVLLLVIAYFVVTSSGFLKSVVLPRASKALQAEITVSDAQISPFSQVVLRNLKVHTTGTEPLVSVTEARLRYHLMDILGGNIRVDEITLSSPTVNLVENPDGTSNLDPFLKTQTTPASKSQKPVQIDIKKIALTDATIRKAKLYKNGNRDQIELSKVNLTVEDLKNGQTGKVTLGAEISLQANPPAPAATGGLQAKLSGSFSFALSPELSPTSLKGNTRLEVSRASGSFAQAANLASEVECEVSPTDIKQVALRFQRGGTPLGQIRLSGPLDLAKTEGRVAVEVRGIDKQLLNAAGSAAGLDFGPTTLNSTNEITLAKGGTLITAAGQLQLSRFQVTRTNQTTPQLDFSTIYNLTVDRSQSNALVRTLTLTGTQQGQPLLKGELTSPMKIGWGNAGDALGDSAFNLTLTKLNLADWRAFTGNAAEAGSISVQAKFLSQRGGSQLSFDIDSRVAGLDAAAGTNRIRQTDIGLQVKGSAVDLKQFDLSQCQLQVSQKNQSLLTVNGSGTFNQTTGSADLQVALEATLARLLEFMPQPGMSITSGTASLKSHITQKDKTQTISGQLSLADFTARIGTNEVHRLGVTSDFDLGLTTPQLQIRKLSGQLTQASEPAATYSVSGTYDLTNQNTDVQIVLQAALARLLQVMPQPDLRFTSGSLDLKTHFTQQQKNQTVAGTVALADLTGTVSSNRFRQYGLTADLDLGITPQELQIRKLAGKLTEGANPGGTFELSGTYGLTNHAAQFSSKLTGINQNGLRPFLEPALADKQLVSVALNLNATAKYQPQGDASVKGDLQVTDLVVKDPKGQFPAKPLAVRLQVDASLLHQEAEVRQLALTLTPTARATNQAVLSGHLNLARSNAIQGNLKLAADSLDLTPYYDLFTAQSGSAMPVSATTARPSPAPSGVEKEPDAVLLPLTNFVAQVNIRRFYLRDVEIADLDTSTRIDGGHITIKPFKLTLNSAPVNSTVDLDLGVAGYRYDVTLSAQKVPLAPMVDSFQPDRKGQVGGTLTAQGNVKGAGITGASLQKNLTGQFDVNSTNLNLAVVNIRNKMLRTVVDVVATVPDLLRNPTSGIGNTFGAITGSQTKGGLSADLEKSPIDTISGRVEVGTGQVNLRQATVQSAAFQANANGTIALASVLTNSTLQIPVSISLSQPIGQRINMVPANTPTNQAYVALPSFLTLRGTVGNPKTDINKLALAGAVVKAVGGYIPSGSTGTVNNVIQGLGSLLNNTNAPAAGTSSNKTSGLLQGLGNLLTTPATNGSSSGTATNESPVGGLLNQLLAPKKSEKKQ